MLVRLNAIAACCEGGGIGKNGDLPWRLRKELQYFGRMTQRVTEDGRQNAVLMGRKTWDSMPAKMKPLRNRINYVLTTNKDAEFVGAIKCHSLQDAMDDFAKRGDDVDTLWVIGGHAVYKMALESPCFHRLYLTRIHATFDCDTFLPPVPSDLISVSDPDVSTEVQEENNIQYHFEMMVWTSVSQSGPYRPPGGVEIQGDGRRVRLEWGAYVTV
ncbi:Dihydrofolate reductase domain [Trinorchestia longiramus]|nr:Dihydrofolate reductase domain [Trinorchestia longiramus]